MQNLIIKIYICRNMKYFLINPKTNYFQYEWISNVIY
jgi:hypothetical protein